MVKIKRWAIGEIYSWITFYPIGIDEDPPVPHWHLVHEYTGDIYDQMGTSTWCYWSQFADPEKARIAALDLASHAQVVTDMCPYCHDSGPQGWGNLHLARWHIYRGQRGEPLVPCYYWDIYNPDPPPGQKWYWPYPYERW